MYIDRLILTGQYQYNQADLHTSFYIMKINSFGIHIKCSDLPRSIRFYSVFALKPVFAYGSKKHLAQFRDISAAPEKYNGVVFKIGESVIELADGHMAVKKEIFKYQIPNSKVSAMVSVDSLDEVLSIAKENNIPIAVSPRIFPWGTKEIVIKDPDGFVLVFIEKL